MVPTTGNPVGPAEQYSTGCSSHVSLGLVTIGGDVLGHKGRVGPYRSRGPSPPAGLPAGDLFGGLEEYRLEFVVREIP